MDRDNEHWRGRVMELIYRDRKGRITQRMVRVIGRREHLLKTYDYSKQAFRWFDTANILAIYPVDAVRKKQAMLNGMFG